MTAPEPFDPNYKLEFTFAVCLVVNCIVLFFFQRIREFRSTLENEITTTISNENLNEQVTTYDSGLSENELSQTTTTTASLPSKSNIISHPLSSSSDVESGINGDYSPSRNPSSSQVSFHHQSSQDINDIPTLERIAFELNSIALDWRSYHAPLHCTCALPFDSAQRKVGKYQISTKNEMKF
jgi:hypothetical protein